MTQRSLAWAALLLLAVTPALGADPGARAPLANADTVTDLALASEAGALAIATQDPSGRLSIPPAPSVPVWHLWSPDGRNLIQDGDADIDACDGGTTLTDDCQTDATAIAVSSDGERLVVGSTANDGDPVLTFVRDTSGPLAAVRGMQGTLLDVAMSDDGQTVAVITDRGVTFDPRGRVYLFNWAAGGATTPNLLWSDTLPLAPTGLALSADGQSLAVTEGTDHHRYKRASATSQVTDANFSGTGMDVAIANGGSHLSIAGSNEGWFILYSDDSTAGSRDLRIRDATSSLDAVAIRNDATAIAVGNAAGTLWVYRLDPVLLSTTLVGQVSLGAAVRDLEFARDGATLAAAAGNSIFHYAVETSSLIPLWSAALPSSTGVVAIDGTGQRVAAGNGTQALVYEAKHRVDLAVPVLPNAAPGQQVSSVLAYSNQGNRMASVAIDVDGPEGWTVTQDVSSLRIAPDGVATLRVNVTAPAGQAPGTYDVTVTSNKGPAGTTTTKLAYMVPTIEAWSLAVEGPSSVAVPSGGGNTFLVRVANLGNAAKAAPVTATIAPTTWQVAVEGATAPIDPGTSRDLIVTVTAPPNSAQLAQGTVTVTLPGATGSPLTLTATVGASFGVDLAGPAAVTLSAGNSTTVSLTLRNTGNAPDTYTLVAGNLPTGWSAAFPGGDSVPLAAGQQATVQLDLAVPSGPSLATAIELSVTARSDGNPGQTDRHTFLGNVQGNQPDPTSTTSTSKSGGRGIPGISGLAIIAAIAFAAVMLSERRY